MGKQRIEIRPSEIRVEDMEEDDLKKTFSTISIKDRHPSTPALRERRVKLCSAGLAHTAAVLDTGELYMWGFNFYGQLGLGDNLTRWSPARVYKDILGALLPPIKHVACGYYSTYIIDSNYLLPH
jgi:alpha-tubulin suppressor-like RCC1 family protein